jgi:hypothetical protein
VDQDTAAERTRLGRRKQPFQLALPETSSESARDEDGLAFVRDAAALELGDRRGERLLPRILLRSRQRESRRLDDHRRSTAALRDHVERRPRERKAKCVSNGCRYIHHLIGRRWGLEDDVLVVDRDEHDTRAREQWNATQAA